MCFHDQVDPEALAAAVEVVKYGQLIDVTKGLNPLKPTDFLLLSQKVARALKREQLPHSMESLRVVLKKMDLDWGRLSKRQQQMAFLSAQVAAEKVYRKALPAVERVFTKEAPGLVKATRKSQARALKLRINTSLTTTDERIVKFVSKSNTLFVRNEMGNRVARMSARARRIVAEELHLGAGRKEISARLQFELSSLNKSEGYWDMIASVFTNRARTFTQMSAFEDAGIERYVFEAVLDERTSTQCRFLHGKVFEVKRAVQLFHRSASLEDPEDVKKVTPFLQMGKTRSGDPVLYYKRGERRVRVADVVDSAEGKLDKVGRYSRAASDRALSKAGVIMPPLHGNCRSTVIADV